MVEPARFSPEELDRIEDALESLGDASAAVVDASPQIVDVLEAYRGILHATRDALPMEEVPQGILAAVFAEAEASAVAAPVVASEPVATPPRWWVRLRKSFLVPSVALAGTAALVLLMGRQHLGEDAIDEAEPDVVAASTPTTPEPADADAPAAAAPAPEAVDVVQPAADNDETVTEAQPTAAGSSQMGNLGDVPNADPEADVPSAAPIVDQPVTQPDAKQVETKRDVGAPRWDLIERADRAREDGDCAAARSDYMVATEDDDVAVRARAYAGVGLCNAQAGDDAGAEDAFERARGIDGKVGRFIAAERNPSGSYKASSKPRKKKRSKPVNARKNKPRSKNSKADLNQSLDPFSP